MKQLRNIMFICLVLVILNACTPALPKIVSNPANPIRKVAVLPFINNSNDVEAPAYVRELFTAQLKQFFYEIKPIDGTDVVLKEQFGVTLGAQLDMMTPKQLGESLGVDAVFYGSLDDFNEKITGVYNVKRVRIRSKLVNCSTAETVWRNGIGIKQGIKATGGVFTDNIPFVSSAISVAGSVSSLASKMSDKNDTVLPKLFGEDVPAPWQEMPEGQGSIEANVALGIGGKIIDKMTHSPLKEQTVIAVGTLLKGYYYGGGSSYTSYGMMLPSGPLATQENIQQ